MERRRVTLYDRIETWRSIQTLYMPGVTQLRQINGTRTDAMPMEHDTEMPELIKLWLPSSLPPGLRESGCTDGLLDKEHRLRVAEADDALVALRRQLRITTGVFNYKKTHVSGTGQKSNTRARTLLSQLTVKTKMFADRYRAARVALINLDPNGDWQRRLLPLRAEDIRGPTKLDDNESEGRRELTWIWLTSRTVQAPVNDGDEFEVAEGMLIYCMSFMYSISFQACVWSGRRHMQGQTAGKKRYFSSQKKCAASSHSLTGRLPGGAPRALVMTMCAPISRMA